MVLGEGLSTVFPGTFKRWTRVITIFKLFAVQIIYLTRIPCAVKRVIKKKGEKKGAGRKNVLEEIEIWQQLSNVPKLIMDRSTEPPVIQCYGYEEDQDFL